MKWLFDPNSLSLFTGWNNKQICSREACAPAETENKWMYFSLARHLFFTICCILVLGVPISHPLTEYQNLHEG